MYDDDDFLGRAMDVVEGQAPTVDRSSKGITWLSSFSFAEGSYPIRFVSDSEKCPRGFHPYCVHEVQRKCPPAGKLERDERPRYYAQILCTLSTHGTVVFTDDAGKPVGSKLAEPCAVCDLYKDLQNTFGDTDPATGKFLGIPDHKLSKSIQDAMEDMRQGTCTSYLFPVLVQGTIFKNDKGFDNLKPGPETHLMILKLNPALYHSDETLLKKIRELFKMDKQITSRENGRWVTLIKGGRGKGTQLIAEDPEPLGKASLELLKKYPNVRTYGTGGDGSFGADKDKRMSYDGAMSFLSETWFVQRIVANTNGRYSIDSIKPGLV